MPENYEVVYTHPSGATATFIRHDGELDALAKGLDADQFWVFKNVKSLLVRNEPDDLAEASRQMRQVGFLASAREITAPAPVSVAEPAYAVAPVVAEEHAGPHLPGPSYWPMLLAASITLAFIGFISWGTLLDTPVAIAIVGIGLICVFINIVGWGLEPA